MVKIQICQIGLEVATINMVMEVLVVVVGSVGGVIPALVWAIHRVELAVRKEGGVRVKILAVVLYKWCQLQQVEPAVCYPRR